MIIVDGSQSEKSISAFANLEELLKDLMPEDLHDGSLSPEMQEYAKTLVLTRLRLTAVMAQYDSALAPALALIKRLEKMQEEINAQIPLLWKNYYLQSPVPWLSPDAWADFGRQMHNSVQGMNAAAAALVLNVGHLGLQIFHKTVLAVRAADARFAPSGVETLHGFKVFAVHVGFTKLEPVYGFHGRGNIAGVDGRGEAVLAVVGQSQGFIHVVEGQHGQHRAKDLAAHNFHILLAVAQ